MYKGNNASTQLAKGFLVLIRNDKQPTNKWFSARVVQLIPNKNNVSVNKINEEKLECFSVWIHTGAQNILYEYNINSQYIHHFFLTLNDYLMDLTQLLIKCTYS